MAEKILKLPDVIKKNSRTFAETKEERKKSNLSNLERMRQKQKTSIDEFTKIIESRKKRLSKLNEQEEVIKISIKN